MSASIAGPARFDPRPVLRQIGPLAALLAATFAFGMVGQSIARPLFIAGCVLVSWDLKRFGAASHMAGCLTLFCLAPFLRRVVDVYAGYEPSGLMISGPLLAILVPAPWLLGSIARGRLDPALRPFLLAGACTLYGMLLTVLNGQIQQALSNGLKWFAPLIYGMWLVDETRRDPLLIDRTVFMAMLLMPLLGVYGFVQYVDPPIWDRYWMTYTSIASIGQPEPFMVRVFSTMNAPAGYATFAAAGLLLFGFGKARWSLFLAAAPTLLGLLLTMYRTAWIALAVGILLGLFHSRTWQRAAMLLVVLPVLGAGVVAFTPAGEVLEQRLQTLGSIGDDGSGQERLAEYAELLNSDGGTLIGHGFESADVLQAGTLPLDGMLVVAWHTMGLPIGIFCVAAVCWAAANGVRGAWRSGTVSGLAVAAILVGAIVQIPLAVVSTSELGFLFWSMAGIGAGLQKPLRRIAI